MTPSILLRRLRGAASLALTWSLSWGAVAGIVGGASTSAILWASGYPAPVSELFGAFALAGALTGAVSALGFAVIGASAGRRLSLSELSGRRLGLWSALPALAVGTAIFGPGEPLIVLATGLFGFAAGAGTVGLARRAALESPSGGRAELTSAS